METARAYVDPGARDGETYQPMLRHASWHPFVLAVFAATGCAQSGAQFNVEYAPGYSQASSSISVFGVFKDGRMSSESWEELGPKLGAALAGGPCEVAYSSELVKANVGLSSAVDDYTRDNGLTDELLDRFGPAARGKQIMTFTISGQTGPATAGTATATPKATSAPPSRRGGGSRGRRRSQAPPAESKGPEKNVLEASAMLFSVVLHRSIAVVSMTYSGSNTDDALQQFAEKIAVSIPGSTCTGWDWNVHVDEDAIRKIIEP